MCHHFFNGFSISRIIPRLSDGQQEGDHLFSSNVFNWITMQSGSIYAEQLDPDLFAVSVDHVMQSCYWSHVSAQFCVRVILQDTLLKQLAEWRHWSF